MNLGFGLIQIYLYRHPLNQFMNLIFAFLAACFFIFHCNLIAMPSQVMIIRHAEKSLQGNELSIKGKERAASFATYFTETKELLFHGLPVAIYATGSAKDNSFKYVVDTVNPLAYKLKLPIQISFQKDDFKRMVDEIKNEPSYNNRNVLICWEHRAIPDIARAFGALQTPSQWSEQTFDRLWVITFSPTGKAIFQNIPQRLMFGDSPN